MRSCDSHVTLQECCLTQVNSSLVHGMCGVDVVEDLPGEGEQVVDVVDVPPPALELLLGLQLARFQVNQRVIHTLLEVKLLPL